MDGPTRGWSREEAIERLLGADEGWSLTSAIEFLVDEAGRREDPADMMAGLMDALSGAGAPLARVRFYFWTLHPLITGLGHEWFPNRPIRRVEIPHGILDQPDYLGTPAQQALETGKPVRVLLEGRHLPADAHSMLKDLQKSGFTDYYAVPMPGVNGRYSLVFLATDRAGGFSDADIGKFDALTRFLGPVLQAASQRSLAVAVLNTYVGPRTGRRVLDGKVRRGDGETIEAALWFSDLRDFTALTEDLDSAQLIATLNAYFEFVHDAVLPCGGEILRFIGDAMLIVFPADGPDGRRDACRRALTAAKTAFASLDALNAERRDDGASPIRFGVGLHVGSVVYGNVGAPARLDFTVMGPAVNRTARLESLTKQANVPMLLSAEFVRLAGCRANRVGAYDVKGVAEPLEAFSLI